MPRSATSDRRSAPPAGPGPEPDDASAGDGGVWTVDIPGLLLPGVNAILRMNSFEYRRYRNDLYVHVRAGLDRDLPPEPLARCAVRIELTRPKRNRLDVDGKYGAIKPLLDVLQPDRTYSRRIGQLRVQDVTPGLGLILADTDGEGGAEGCVSDLRVVQIVGEAHVRVRVRETG